MPNKPKPRTLGVEPLKSGKDFGTFGERDSVDDSKTKRAVQRDIAARFFT